MATERIAEYTVGTRPVGDADLPVISYLERERTPAGVFWRVVFNACQDGNSGTEVFRTKGEAVTRLDAHVKTTQALEYAARRRGGH